MTALLWLRRLAGKHAWRAGGAALGVGMCIALLGTLGAFLTASFGTMTDRVIGGLPVDWQVQMARTAEAQSVLRGISAAFPVAAASQVNYAEVNGFSAATGGTVQTTGAGQVVGVDETYAARFPGMFRLLVGSSKGVLLAQQTAANLHARVGDRITVQKRGQKPLDATVDGIVDLPFADSFFQAVGVPGAAAPQAPPDNVLIVPTTLWHRWFDSRGRAGAYGAVHSQWHVRFRRNFPHDPVGALLAVASAAKNVELRSAGAAAIGDNLSAALQSAREDSLYARLLFLFLGLPGAVLALCVALAFIASSGDRRRREAALLRIRGASAADIAYLSSAEAAAVSVAGAVLGMGLTFVAVRQLVGNVAGTGQAAFVFAAAAALAATACVFGAYLFPLVGGAAAGSTTSPIEVSATPAWRRYGVDWILLAASAIFFWKTAATGYQVVLAPEGVLQSAVSYDSFAGPLLLWLGAALLVRRFSEGVLARRGATIERIIAPLAGPLSGAIAAALSRQRSIVGRGLTLLALAVSFAVSTAVFNSTYNAQARVDAQLTNGSDVTVTIPDRARRSSVLGKVSGLPGVAAAGHMVHRFAYVGQDLQDFYAIEPTSITDATQMSDAYFGNRDARATLAQLAAQPDGVLVSEETVKDYQLKLGDRINLRLQFARDRQLHPIAFTFIGVVREFPTAPHDSFIVGNASYVTKTTGETGEMVILLRAAGDPGALAAAVRQKFAAVPGARVTDIGSVQRTVGSSLTAVDLRGLSEVELTFALVLLAGVAGLSLALGFAERRKTFAILSALGATKAQLAAFLWAEAGVMLLGGLVAGFALGLGVAAMLTKVLTGVFDPPPLALAIPWAYLVALCVLAFAATAVAVAAANALARRDPVRVLRA